MKPKPLTPATAGYPLTVANRQFAAFIVRQQLKRGVCADRISFEDLVQCAVIGMMDAETRFDPTRQVKFITFAWHYINRAIQNALIEDDAIVRHPQSTRSAKGLHLKPVVVDLDGPVRTKTGELSDPAELDTYRALRTAPDHTAVDHIDLRILDLLDDRERLVLISHANGRKLHEIGTDLGVSRERVRQIESKAKTKLLRRHLAVATARPKAEKQIQQQILREFATQSWCRLWRQNTGVAVFLSPLFRLVGRVLSRSSIDALPRVAFGLPGSADLSGVLRGGRRIEIEVKSATGEQRLQQRRFGAMINNFGGIYIVARSVADVYKGLTAAGYDYTSQG